MGYWTGWRVGGLENRTGGRYQEGDGSLVHGGEDSALGEG